MYCIKEKIDPSRESEPKDFHINYSLVGLSLKCLHFLSYKSEAPLPFDSVCRGVGYFLRRNIIQYRRSEYCYQGAIQLLLEYQIHLQNAGRNLFCF